MIKVITDKNEWNNLVNNAQASFFQSFEWGEILQSIGQKIERIFVEEGEEKLLAQVVYKKFPFGLEYAQIHKGPVFRCHSDRPSQGAEESLNELIQYLRKKGCVFVRLEPTKLDIFPLDIKKRLKLIGDINPPATFILDLDRSEDEILKSFHSKTRYNINLAQRKNLKISHEKNFEIFWDLFKKTGERDNFTLHPESTYCAAINHPIVKQITIFDNDIALASVCLFEFGETVYYLYGASDHAYRQSMAPYLAQWEAIKLAKNSGYKFYDFFGTSPRLSNCHSDPPTGGEESLQPDSYTYDPNHRYAGVSRFKVGFNATYHEDPGTFDLPLRPMIYYFYKFIRSVLSLRAKRGNLIHSA